MTRQPSAFASPPPSASRASAVAVARAVLLGFLVACWLTLQALALSHHHDDGAAEAACAVCHVIQHQPVQTPAPPPVAVLGLLVLLCVLPILQAHARVDAARATVYLSRAPPRG